MNGTDGEEWGTAWQAFGRGGHDARAGAKEGRQVRVVQLSGSLVVTDAKLNAVRVGTQRLERADAVVDEPSQVIEDVAAAEKPGVADRSAHVTDVPMRVDQCGHDRFSGQVDHHRGIGGARRTIAVYSADALDYSFTHRDNGVVDHSLAVAND